MNKRRTARELEAEAASAPRPRTVQPPVPLGEAERMLARRGFRTKPAVPDLPFPPDLEPAAADRLAEKLGHYAFRLFLRGAIQAPASFAPAEATRYLEPAQAKEASEALVRLGLAARLPAGRYRLIQTARSFGGTLEWYVARELRRQFGFDVATGLEFRAAGIGGDLDVVGAAEGKLIYVELKSSPPKNLSTAETTAFLDRLLALRPEVALFVMDTALRLSDKVLPMLVADLESRPGKAPVEPARLARGVWALSPHIYLVNAHRDLMRNIARAIAEGLRELSPLPW